jgi:hypothetical protein
MWLNDIDACLKFADNISSICEEPIAPPQWEPNDRIAYMLAWFNLARQHHRALILLTRSALHSSARALMRPVVEVSARAIWLGHIASDEDIERVSKGRGSGIPGMNEILSEIDVKFSADIRKSFLKRGILHDFTHGGIQAVATHMDALEMNGESMEKNQQTAAVMVGWSALSLGFAASCIANYFSRSDIAEALNNLVPDLE